MDVLITGGCGFVGVALTRLLLRVECSVTAVDHRPAPCSHPRGRYEHHRRPWSDLEAMDMLLSRDRYDAIIHLGWLGMPDPSSGKAESDAHASVHASLRLVDSCLRHGIRRFIFASSGAVYGATGGSPAVEWMSASPLCAYGRGKLVVEGYLHAAHLEHGLSYAALRIGNAYGPGQDPDRTHGIVAVLGKRIRCGETVDIWGDGSAVRDYVHIDDVASAIQSAVRSDAIGCYNVGTGLGTTVLDVVRLLGNHLGHRPIVRHQPSRAMDTHDVILDVAKAEREIAWKPTIAFDAGVRQTMRWLDRACALRPETDGRSGNVSEAGPHASPDARAPAPR